MPKPLPGESKNKYINRAIEYFVHQEGRSPNEAVGRAEGFWRSYGHNKKSIWRKKGGN